ncbi:MAG: type I-C CRISPR-associated protein Cas7/Csd2 [Planctomycetes bacterium]|nr:type I-C CRISPR-associated protein Cas7/Csd2 [Planctomycetota bacterium]MBI3843131.1 type I-C CRISPR-associated protein Cas7/Csd2 [Planctomycetota bacterium]
MTIPTDVTHRYDFLVLFDVKDGNPNGDPDAANQPRIDPETGCGIVSDVCLKRKLRNFVLLAKEEQRGYDIYVKEKAVLENLQKQVYAELDLETASAKQAGKRGAKSAGSEEAGKRASEGGEAVSRARRAMCERYFDVRAFGAVMSLKEANCGQVRGPVQLTFSRSVDPVLTLEHSITRMAVATQKEADAQQGDNRTMGRKNTVPYGLYVGRGFFSPHLAAQTGFSADDLALLWQGLQMMFEHDRSSARGLMSTRRLVVFEHDSSLGRAAAHRLFDTVEGSDPSGHRLLRRRDESRPARDFMDYLIPTTKEIEGRLAAGGIAGIRVHELA